MQVTYTEVMVDWGIAEAVSPGFGHWYNANSATRIQDSLLVKIVTGEARTAADLNADECAQLIRALRYY